MNSRDTDLVEAAKFVADYGFYVVAAILFVLALIVRDVAFIESHPWTVFATETIMSGFLPSVMYMLVLSISRQLSWKTAITLTIIMTLTFSAVHVLCQLAGIYTSFL